MAGTVPQRIDEAAPPTVVQAAPSLHRGMPSDLDAGMQVDDFDLLAILGEGAFARVFLARQRSLQRTVALKVSEDRGFEPQTLAQLDHPHIVRVFDQRHVPDRGLRLLYMSYLAGGTLRDVIGLVKKTPPAVRTGQLLLTAVDAALAYRGEEPPSDSTTRSMIAAMSWPETVCWLGVRMADALHYAHTRGVLHLDLKPANVLLGADCSPRLADFNVSTSKAVAGATDCFGGSIGYMSPEQLDVFNPASTRQPNSLDGRSDLFSLAVTLWELLTGTRPYASSEPDTESSLPITTMVEHRKLGLSTVTTQALPAGMPPGLEEILRQCLAADPEHRDASAALTARKLDLCRKPRSRELLIPRPGWRTFVSKHPYSTLLTVGLIPNLIAAWFSIVYNKTALVDHYPAAGDTFKMLQLILNGTLFPICIGLFVMSIFPVARGLKELRNRSALTDPLPRLRRRTLHLGPLSVIVVVWAWVFAGIVFPVVMHFTVHELPISFHLHFLASQTLCGLIAVSYPQFGVTFLALRTLYPHFVADGSLGADDVQQLNRIDRLQGIFLVVAVSIPFLAVGLLAVIGAENRVALGVLSIIGLGGSILAWVLTNQIRADKAAIEEALAN